MNKSYVIPDLWTQSIISDLLLGTHWVHGFMRGWWQADKPSLEFWSSLIWLEIDFLLGRMADTIVGNIANPVQVAIADAASLRCGTCGGPCVLPLILLSIARCTGGRVLLSRNYIVSSCGTRTKVLLFLFFFLFLFSWHQLWFFDQLDDVQHWSFSTSLVDLREVCPAQPSFSLKSEKLVTRLFSLSSNKIFF